MALTAAIRRAWFRHQVIRLSATFGPLLCGGCADGGGECGNEAWGGGEFTVAFSGGIEGVVTGAGLDKDELEDWFRDFHNPIDAGGRYADYGVTGGLYMEPRGPSDYEGFVAGVELEAPLGGCEDALFLRLYIAPNDVPSIALESGYQIPFDGAWANGVTFEGGRSGRASLTTHNLQHGDCAPDQAAVEIDVVWEMDPDVHVVHRHECGGLDSLAP